MEDQLAKLARGLFESAEPQKDTTETPKPILLESILPSLPPEGQAWLNGLNPFCRRAVEHDSRVAGPDLFVQYWERLRDTLQKLERDFGPSDNWEIACLDKGCSHTRILSRQAVHQRRGLRRADPNAS